MRVKLFDRLPERIRKKVIFAPCLVKGLKGDCWLWTGAIRKGGLGKGGGYCTTSFEGERDYVHRLVFVLTGNRIPLHKQLDHLCRVRRCCNPRHVEPVTRKINILRGQSIPAKNARKTHCPKGHNLKHARLRNKPTGLSRECRICDRQRVRRYRANHLEQIKKHQREYYRRKCARNSY